MKLNLITSVRTNNFSDEKVMEKIKGMWGKASRELEKYKGNVYGVYYNYESNYKGDYSLGVAISNGDFSFDDSSVIVLPNIHNYKTSAVDTNDEQGVFKAWSKIWELEESGSLKRAYTYDLEKYYPNGEIEIHIAVKDE